MIRRAINRWGVQMFRRWWQGTSARVDESHEPAPQTNVATPACNPPDAGVQVRTGPVPRTLPEQLFSLAALRRAWLAVRGAGGGAGVDGMTIKVFSSRLDEELTSLQAELIDGRYRPQPLRQVLVPKESGGLRPLALWALRDRVAQRTVYEIIAPSFEVQFLACSFGFRPGLGVEDALRKLEEARDANRLWVVDGDIHHCFDEIDSRRLLGLVRQRVYDPLLLRYISGWLTQHILNSADGVPKAAGASQGSVLSPLLANIYLHRFDLEMIRRGLLLLRYADDFVICCQRKQEAQQALEMAKRALGRIGLRVSEGKTRIVHFDEGFEWLGYFLVQRRRYRV